jgi:outer membrane protein assembly factor BamB
VVDDTVYFGSDDGHLYALDAATGAESWSHRLGGEVASPAVSDGLVYVGGGESVYSITTGGEREWQSVTDDSVVASPAVAGGTVYVGSTDGNLYAFDGADGDEQWRFSTNSDVWSSAAVVDGVVYVGSLDDTVYAVDAKDGTELWQFTTGEAVYSSPAVLDGVAYVGSRDGRVYAFEAGATGNVIQWEEAGSEYAKQGCSNGGDSYWHWALSRGGSTPLQDGAELTVTFEGGLEETFDGYFPGAGRGAVHFETSRDGDDEVRAAEVTFDGGGEHPLLVLNRGTCLGPDEDPPAVIPEQGETADEPEYWQVDFGEGANPPIPPQYWPNDGMWALGNAEDGVTQNISGTRQKKDGQLADVDIVDGEFDFDDEGDPKSVTVAFEIDDNGAPRHLHLAFFAMPGPFEMDEIDDQVLINTISDEFEGGEEGELTISLQ